jgi:hypothetical protein
LPFSGVFDGNKLDAINLNVNTGLFNNSGTIRNVYHTFTGRSYIYTNASGGLVEDCNTTINVSGTLLNNICGFCAINLAGGIIQNCIANGVINSQSGNTVIIAGFSIINGGTIQNCESYVDLENDSGNAAGFILRIESNSTYGDMNGDLLNCHAYGSVTTNAVGGGFISHIESLVVNIQNCSADGNVDASSNSSGGFVGLISNAASGAITECKATGNVTGVGNGFGGFVGNIDAGVAITECKATGNVNVDGLYIGGFVGVTRDTGNITNCYASGDVTGNDTVAGFCGWNRASLAINNVYSIGLVTANTGTETGGLCARNDSTITNSYWDTVTSGQASSDGGTGKTTTEMKEGLIDDPDTDGIYVNWDDAIWDEGTTSEYPKLQWE